MVLQRARGTVLTASIHRAGCCADALSPAFAVMEWKSLHNTGVRESRSVKLAAHEGDVAWLSRATAEWPGLSGYHP